MAHLDGFGHGTHLASIIAGRDAAGTPSSYLDPAASPGSRPTPPWSTSRSAPSNGAVDVTQVIAGIDWVVEHAKDDGLNIRVINLSYGTDSVQASTVDPLAYAVENAWKHGIVVVAAGGNDGETGKTLADPAYDPHVLAVGAMDDAGTVSAADDTVPDVVHPRHRRPARRRRRPGCLGARGCACPADWPTRRTRRRASGTGSPGPRAPRRPPRWSAARSR